MFSTVFIGISLIFVHFGQENFGKTVRDPPLLLPLREYGHAMCGMFVRVRYLERMGDTKKGQKVKLVLKNFFYIRRVLFISLSTSSKRRTTILFAYLHKSAFCDILSYAEQSGMCYNMLSYDINKTCKHQKLLKNIQSKFPNKLHRLPM